eukprot:365605-Chlamydomonas_euryale.AAC.4
MRARRAERRGHGVVNHEGTTCLETKARRRRRRAALIAKLETQNTCVRFALFHTVTYPPPPPANASTNEQCAATCSNSFPSNTWSCKDKSRGGTARFMWPWARRARGREHGVVRGTQSNRGTGEKSEREGGAQRCERDTFKPGHG